ncbi:T9SS type A sorting domain-containing protein [Fibrobacter succinogenes]|uniref:T9SS type A sorting domain-containing protein n=1 Tax=Fibrobacter succinogenes TaxID=833 RepID=UPI001569FFB9|nr:T9SS type A sorting domain-containing protein [Fibrobacter succinogenes]
MKKITLAALCVATATFAGTFETWNGADGVPAVETGLGNETNTYGIWYDFNDSFSGGESKIIYPVPPCHEYETCEPHYMDAVIAHCEGICGTATLNSGTLTTKPFSGIGFNIVGETSTTDKTLVAGNASAWAGLCVTYTSDTDISLELGLGEKIDSTMNYANPAVTLPASQTDKRVVVSWSDFKQPSWYDGSVKFDGETAAKQLVGVHFKIQAEPGEYKFNICSVGPKDGTCPEKCGMPSAGIQIARGVSTVNAILNGRALGFTGIKSTATVEVMNSLGQVVMKGAINNATLNLAHLDAGIYMIHVTGKAVNFTNRIVVR